jgi:lipoate-protein ligase A
MQCFGFIDEAREASENMRLDQQMLQAAVNQEAIFVRVYEWSEPSVSLGYFQEYADRFQHPESLELALVRRSTGGGAIVHDHDWTYSVAVPPSGDLAATGASQRLYDGVHDAVVEWLGTNLGIAATRWPEATCPKSNCPFLCFERRALGDVLVGTSKVMGSAQRRHQGGLLQHGSLLLKRSSFAPSLAGLGEYAGQENAALDTTNMFSPASKSSFSGAVFTAIAHLTSTRVTQANFVEELQSLKIATDFEDEAWTKRR